jgi:hypothetical protein
VYQVPANRRRRLQQCVDAEVTMSGAGGDEFDVDPEELRKRFWDGADANTKGTKTNGSGASHWDAPDMGVLQMRRRRAPALPLGVFGCQWGPWIADAARAASCPPEYVALPLLAVASTLIGNSRWAQAAPSWKEPPHLWMGSVGDSGDGKSPGADCLMRDVVPEIESRMLGDFPERYQEWRAAVAYDKAAIKYWEGEQRAALKEGIPFDKPMPKATASDVEPQRPCLQHHDITIEELAAVLSTGAPKGVLVTRDELSGWLNSMTVYNQSGRAFWVEAYGGRPYRVARRKHSGCPIEIPRLVAAVYGGTQPERLAQLFTQPDDGMLARIQWGWPDPVPFKLGKKTPNVSWAIAAFDRLRELEMQPGNPPSPVLVPLTAAGERLIEEFGQDIQSRQANAGGLLRSAFGKARGTALRLSLVLEELWWSGRDGLALPPSTISEEAFKAAAALVSSYFMPMAERVFGDATATDTERMAATLARWIIRQQPDEVHVRRLQRMERLPGLRTAAQIKRAADSLVDADWLRAPIRKTGEGRPPVIYLVNPLLKAKGA